MAVSGSKKRKARAASSSSSSESSSSDESDAPVEKKMPARLSEAAMRESLRLDPPKFSLGGDNSSQNGNNGELDSNRYELWSFRLPASIPIQDLDGCELTVPATAAASAAGGILSAPAAENGKAAAAAAAASSNNPFSFATKNGDNYTLRWGHQVENESFRVLVPYKDGDDESEDEDNDNNNKKQFLAPANAPFQRHINVVSVVEEVSETKLAPGMETAPKPNLVTRGIPHQMRRAYQHVPQKTGLKRRWMPLGSKGGADVVQEESRPRSLSASSLLLDKQKRRKRSMSGPTEDRHQAEEGKRKRSGSGQPTSSYSNHTAPNGRIIKAKNESSSDDSSKPTESKAEKKARKAAKKEQKKAKKEAKQAKKEAKKAKKEKKTKKEE